MHVKFPTIQEYINSLQPLDKSISDLLTQEINTHLQESTSNIWHGHPVWFLEGNPIVGYSKLKNGVKLLFWSGQSFAVDGLEPEGSFKAASTTYTAVSQIDRNRLSEWLKKSKLIQWDYKNIVKRRGILERLK